MDPIQEKVSIYTQERVNHQLFWYKKKSDTNSIKIKTIFLFYFLTCNCGAIYFSALQESGISVTGSEGALLASCATALIGWMESRKYKDLSAAYSLTKNEISTLLHDTHNISNQNELSDFVTEAESLFSREHTQWAAKRGYTKST